MLRQHLWHAGFLGLTLAFTGCSSGSGGGDASRHPDSATPIAPAVDPHKPDATGDPNDPASLAKRTSQYAQELTPLLDQHAPMGRPSTAPSVVQWVDPATHPAVPVEPPKTPAVVPDPPLTTGGANHSTVITPIVHPKDEGIPQILPESADFHGNDTKVPTVAVTIPTDDYEKKLRQQVTDYPHDLGGQIDYQLLRFVRGEVSPELGTLSGLGAEDREIVSALMDGLSNFRNTVRADGNVLLSRKIQSLLEMADRLRSQAELTIPSVALCTDVESFGVYKPVAASRFAAGHENPVIVYCEVGNFNSIQNDQKMWETKLRQETVIYTETGMPVWPEKSNTQSFTDLSRHRRHDFFLARIVKLPANLTIGRYLLKVTLTDEQTNRVCEASIPLEIVAQ